MRRQMIMMGIVACVLALVIGGLSIAQPPAGGQGGPGGPGGPGGRFGDPAQMRQMIAQRMKEQMDVNDAVWQVMEPRLMKVWELNRQTAGGPGRGGMMFFGGRRGQDGGQNDRGPRDGQNRQFRPPDQETATDKAAEQLRTTLDKKDASPEEIKKQLTALRAAREQAKQELADAQQKLREILNLRQEALLVMAGLLN
jgi:hypothetical protein